MKYLLNYNLDNQFKADQVSAGGNGDDVVSVVDGVAWTADREKVYYRRGPLTQDTLTSYTVTVQYVYYRDGSQLSNSYSYTVDSFKNKSVKEFLMPISIDDYVPLESGKTIWVSGDTTYSFKYKAKPDYSVPLTFDIISGGTIYWNSAYDSIEYNRNGYGWGTLPSSLDVYAGDEIQFRGNYFSYGNFSASTNTRFSVRGNIMSLIDGTGFTKETSLGTNGGLEVLFEGCGGLINACELILPATALTNNCYNRMFNGCTSLTTAPELPATTLANYCYTSMFAGCTSLTSAPELPATALTEYCYSNMFQGCTSLTTAPELPPITLANYCYQYMFRGCTSLTTAPELPATTLAQFCYTSMFSGCTSLTTAPSILPATTLATYCYSSMFQGCASLTTAPALPATTLAIYCYRYMFQGCTSLNYIKCLAIYKSASGCTNGWVNGVASSGTFVKHPSTSWSRGVDGVPNDWTITNSTD